MRCEREMGWRTAAMWLAPTAIFVLAWRVPQWLGRAGDAVERRRARYRPTSPPVERLAADLRRLSREIERLESGSTKTSMLKLRATVTAYDDTLLSCCRSLGVPPPRDRGPLDPHERLDTEVALLQEGLTW